WWTTPVPTGKRSSTSTSRRSPSLSSAVCSVPTPAGACASPLCRRTPSPPFRASRFGSRKIELRKTSPPRHGGAELGFSPCLRGEERSEHALSFRRPIRSSSRVVSLCITRRNAMTTQPAPGERVHYHACPLCEATCGLEIRTRGREVVAIRGDAEDVFSRGFICPKGYAVKELDADPDRLRTPLIKRDGRFEAVSWDDAFAEIERRLLPIIERHGRDAVAVYLGNPSAHSMQLAIYNQVFLRALGSRNIYSASTVDQMPKQVAVGLMFGTVLSVPVPDLDSTDYLMILGA